jgi:ribosomal protein S18 acetylase RimI-like enzyme
MTAMPAPTIIRAAGETDLDAVRGLFAEYAGWVGVDLEFQGFQQEVSTLPGGYRPPRGRLYIAIHEAEPVGCVGLRPLDETTGEIKRLFVRPSLRGQAIGRRLMNEVLAAARDIGYDRLRLDTLPTMSAAIRLYRSLGFADIAPYRANPIAGARFLELVLRC